MDIYRRICTKIIHFVSKQRKHTRKTLSQHEPYGFELNDRPPRQTSGCCSHRIIDSITSGSCDGLPFYRDTTGHRRWAPRVTSSLLYPYPGARPRLLIQQLLIHKFVL
ncbi:hypothetical protein AVEN_161216-1 [Araneus ventricosus]|uniref:Uncharacterized protein n=1 Tax=Araneus ventricosus TaxID=182803 RepID=A0A4Y2NBL2_ARAVE|nr:hypothetical protein AVEN_161216-1 [Araneus ventricosus]